MHYLPDVLASFRQHHPRVRLKVACDLTLNLIHTGKGSIGGAMRYSTDLFDASTVGRMLGHFETLLGSIVADAGARVGALEMLKNLALQLPSFVHPLLLISMALIYR